MSNDEQGELCPCGSGLPRRRCHGSILSSPGAIPIGKGDPNSPEEHVSLVGFPERIRRFTCSIGLRVMIHEILSRSEEHLGNMR